jgi:hypothetical protein
MSRFLTKWRFDFWVVVSGGIIARWTMYLVKNIPNNDIASIKMMRNILGRIAEFAAMLFYCEGGNAEEEREFC